ncbi:MAG: lipoprotein-releasing ABC transporter permease subunit [Pseudomonadota bacterium]
MSAGVEFLIAMRYLRSRQSTRIASFISVASLIGIAIGVAALITILSVMNGFERELRTRLLDMQAHVTIKAASGGLSDWRAVAARVGEFQDVTRARPAVTAEGMARAGGRLIPLLIEGIDPQFELNDGGLARAVSAGALESLRAGEQGLILGRYLSLDLVVSPGESITLLVPRVTDGQVSPRLVRFNVAGLFDSGVPDYDARVAYMHWQDAATLVGLQSAVSELRVDVVDVLRAAQVGQAIAEALGTDYVVSDWSAENASYFRAIRLEKTMMALMLSLVIGVAAFNIIASLVMVVTDKETDIAILRTLGLSSEGVVRVFFIQGLIIGWLGVLVGVLGGTMLALNVTEVAAFLERLVGFQVMPSDVYVMTVIPSEVKSMQILAIAGLALLLTTLATWYPARQAAAVHPAQALRYS